MTTIGMYLSQLALTLLACFLLSSYLRPHLKRVLVDPCKTDARAGFWAAFSNILLIALPVIIGMGYLPYIIAGRASFFEAAGRVRWNPLGLILALLVIGAAVSFLALVAPRSQENQPEGRPE
jgi:hypothetical protein